MSAVAAGDDGSEIGAVKGVEKGGGVSVVVAVSWRSGEETLLKYREDREDR